MDMSPEEFVRFVSRVPFQLDVHMTEGQKDCWCTTEEFMELAGGDWEEHAIMLRNYFAFYERQTQVWVFLCLCFSCWRVGALRQDKRQ